MKATTKKAIEMLLRIDPTVTREERMALNGAMSGAAARQAELDPSADFTIADAAGYLSMSRTTLWRMCDRGDVLSVRRGKKFYIPGAEVMRLKSEEVAA